MSRDDDVDDEEDWVWFVIVGIGVLFVFVRINNIKGDCVHHVCCT